MGESEMQVNVSSGLPPGTSIAPQLEEASIVVSDLHMSEGLAKLEKYKPSWLRRLVWWIGGAFFSVTPHPLVNRRNPLEDFPDDKPFVDFLDKVAEKYGSAGSIVLRLLGDTFDPLAMTWNGKFADPPYEQVAAGKMGRIIAGHQAFFNALLRFIRRPNCHVVFYVGNHDLFLVWERVQRKLVFRLTGGDPALEKKVRFVDQRQGFREIDRGVEYYHGQDAEANNATDPKDVILTHRFGVALKQPILNVPYGSHMVVGVLSRIKLRNPLVGRLTNYKALYRNAAIHTWGWAFYTVLALIGNYVRCAFFDIWDVRRKTKLANTIRVVLQTVDEEPVDKYAKKRLKELQGRAKVVMYAHSHKCLRVTDENGTYINTGTWGQMFDLTWPQFDLKWKRFRHLELVWLTTKHLLQTGELRFASYITRILGWIAFVLISATFLLYSFPKEGFKLWSYTLVDFKAPIFILLIFALSSGLVRVLSVKPTVVPRRRLTFGLVRHFSDGGLNAELMEYQPADNSFREFV